MTASAVLTVNRGGIVPEHPRATGIRQNRQQGDSAPTYARTMENSSGTAKPRLQSSATWADTLLQRSPPKPTTAGPVDRTLSFPAFKDKDSATALTGEVLKSR